MGCSIRFSVYVYIKRETKQEITISHNMLNSLNDTVAHTHTYTYESEKSGNVQAVGYCRIHSVCLNHGLVLCRYLCSVSHVKNHWLRFTNRSTFSNSLNTTNETIVDDDDADDDDLHVLRLLQLYLTFKL